MDSTEVERDATLDTELLKANLEAFAQVLPGLARLFENHVPASKLVRNADGDWDVEFRGQYLYGPGGRARAEDASAALAGTVDGRIRLNPPSSHNLDAVAASCVYQTLKRSVDAGISFNEDPALDDGFHLVTFGFGLGYHLPKLIEISNCHSICIVEPNLDFLYHSLAVFDWRPILDRVKVSARAVTFIISQTATEIAQEARTHCRAACPMAIDWSVIVLPYPSDVMTGARNEFLRDAGFIPVGLGFLHDEMEMTRASYRNLCEGDHRLFQGYGGRLKSPVFVVGSGPSIDQDIEFLKANQHRAVIFSCGTAARVLLANGIQPDFQILLENGEVPAEVMATTAEEYPAFKESVLIAATTVSPKAKTLFKETVFFFRQALSSYALFCLGPAYTLDNPGPTVTNTGLVIALALGFQDIYLFGTDLGSRHQNRHHSRHSLYRDDGDEEIKGAIKFNGEFTNVDVGNFGGLIYTDYIMGWSRDTMVRTLSGHVRLGQQVFNCSDGLLITGARPQSSGSIRLKSTAEGKASDLGVLMKHFPPARAETFRERWTGTDWLERVRNLVAQVSALTDDPEVDGFTLMDQGCRLLIRDFERPAAFEEFFIRGSTLSSLMAFDYYFRRVPNAEKRDKFREIGLEEVNRHLSAIVRQAEWFFENIDDFKSYEDLEERLREWVYD